ncbi:MAG TPA: efflux RND transporter periplasmic adaptor subunit [Anaerolineales bacterium]|nr:efflux RND transporter periplasmic adaptor subunit [Anaerolineales bacterium]
MKRWMIIAGAVVVLLAVVIGVRSAGAARRSALEGLQTTELTSGSLTATVGATGTVRANQHAILGFDTSGTVGEVFAATGDTVSTGERLAELRQSSLSAQIILAQADLVAAERALEDVLHSREAAALAQAAVADAQDALEDAEYYYRVRQEGNRATADTIEGAKYRLRLAQDKLEEAQEAYDRASGDAAKAVTYDRYASARTAYNSALATYNWYTGHPTDIEQAQLEADVALAQAQLDDALREYERLKDGPNPDDVAAAEARVAAAQATLELAWISAPFSGMISRVDVKPGDQVAPGGTAFELVDMSQLLVDVDVSEIDINRIQAGQPATLSFDAILDRTYTGHVTEVGLAGASVQGVVSFRVTVELDDADEQVRPGLTAAVNIVVEQIENTLLVPNRAVRVRDGERVVYVLRDDIPVPIPVRLGVSSETDSQVLEGELAEGDLIVLNPPTELADFGPPRPGMFIRR